MLLEAVKEQGAYCDEMKRLEAANLRFGLNLINQYQHRGLTLEELIEAGEASLRKATTNFNLNSGIKFITYAVTQMRQDTEALTSQLSKRREKENTTEGNRIRPSPLLRRWARVNYLFCGDEKTKPRSQNGRGLL